MRLKQYLRGLGIGIVVTAIVLGSAVSGKNLTMTDEEVITRAKELGMREDRFLDDFELSTTPTVTEPIVSNDEEADEALNAQILAELQAEKSVEPTVAPTAVPTAVPTAESQVISAEEAADMGMIVMVIQQGDSSNAVADKLFLLGVVDNAKKFDLYLCENGYDKRIKVGTIKIPKQGTYETIAKIISTN